MLFSPTGKSIPVGVKKAFRRALNQRPADSALPYRERLNAIMQITIAIRIDGSILMDRSKSAVCQKLPTNVKIAVSSDFGMSITVLL